MWADEPTGALDSETAEIVMKLLAELNSEGLTLVVVTHDEEVGRSAHRLVTMRDGRIVNDEVMLGADARDRDRGDPVAAGCSHLADAAGVAAARLTQRGATAA